MRSRGKMVDKARGKGERKIQGERANRDKI